MGVCVCLGECVCVCACVCVSVYERVFGESSLIDGTIPNGTRPLYRQPVQCVRKHARMRLRMHVCVCSRAHTRALGVWVWVGLCTP